MATYRYIDDVIPGDTYRLLRTLPITPDGVIVVNGYWTIKKDPAAPDSKAIIKKVITADMSTRVGGLLAATNELYFVITAEESNLLEASTTYYYDIQVETNSNDVYTIEMGKLFTSYNINRSK